MINLKDKKYMFCKIIILALIMMRLGVSLAWNGQIRPVKYSFWWTLVSTAIFIGLLYGAGLFN